MFKKHDAVVLLIDVDSCYSWADPEDEAVPLAAMGDIGVITHVDTHEAADLLDNSGCLQADVSPDNSPGLRLNMLLQHIRKLPPLERVNYRTYVTTWGEWDLLLNNWGDSIYWSLRVERRGKLVDSRFTDLPVIADEVEVREWLARAWAHFWKGLNNA